MLRLPKLCRHKSKKLAYVTDPRDSREVYFGPWGSTEAETKYRRWCERYLRWLENPVCGGSLLAEVAADYLQIAERVYQKRGKPTSEAYSIRTALADLTDMHGDFFCDDLRPSHLKALRKTWIAKGWRRKHVNEQFNRVTRCLSWAVEEERMSESAYRPIAEISPLRKGWTDAGESERIEPAPEPHIEIVIAACEETRPILADLIRLHYLTGMRAGEVVACRADRINRDREPWVYEVAEENNKNAHKGIARTVPLGPKAREVVARRMVDAEVHARRRIPETWKGWLFPSRGRGPHSCVRSHLSVSAYRQAVRRICEDKGIPVWTPLQIRHTALTLIRERAGLEAAQVLAGHTRADTTEIYAERNFGLACRVAEEHG